jgi:hypothetical protein
MALFDSPKPFDPDVCSHCGSNLEQDSISTIPAERNNPGVPGGLAEADVCPYCGSPWPTELAELSKTRGLLTFMPTSATQMPPTHVMYPSLILVESRREIPLPTDSPIYLGRRDATPNIYPHIDPTCDNAATYGVSRRHACIHRSTNGAYIEDMGSKSGTFVNDQRLFPSKLHPLDHGDRLFVGQLELAVTFSQ